MLPPTRRAAPRWLATLAAAIALILSGMGRGSAQPPDIDTRGLGSGPYAVMEAQLEVTFLGIDIVELRVRFDEATAAEIRRVARGRGDSEERAAQIARVAARAESALAHLRFERDVELGRFIDEAREDLGRARQWGLIDAAALRTISAELPRSFAPIEGRGFREGDELIYRVYPDSLRIVLVDRDGEVLLDLEAEGRERRLALLGSYFAPGSQFREDLIDSAL